MEVMYIGSKWKWDGAGAGAYGRGAEFELGLMARVKDPVQRPSMGSGHYLSPTRGDRPIQGDLLVGPIQGDRYRHLNQTLKSSSTRSSRFLLRVLGNRISQTRISRPPHVKDVKRSVASVVNALSSRSTLDALSPRSTCRISAGPRRFRVGLCDSEGGTNPRPLPRTLPRTPA